MTGKEAIIHYLGTHKSFCAQDVAGNRRNSNQHKPGCG